MKEITLKEWSAYLPYGLICEVKDQGGIEIDTLFGVYDSKELLFHNIVEFYQGFESVKPILYDLSWLTRDEFREEILIYFKSLGIDAEIVIYGSGNDIENDFTLLVNYRLMGETFTDALINRGSTEETPTRFFEWLCKNHFNVFNSPEELIVRVTEDFNPYK